MGLTGSTVRRMMRLQRAKIVSVIAKANPGLPFVVIHVARTATGGLDRDRIQSFPGEWICCHLPVCPLVEEI
jgi:hypothetical protein